MSNRFFCLTLLVPLVLALSGDASPGGDKATGRVPAAPPAVASDDTPLGRLGDWQGLAFLRPRDGARWTPISERLPLHSGDWLRTESDPPGAAALGLSREVGVILGPGTQLEVVSPTRLHLVSGEVRINTPPKRPVELVGPDGRQTVAVEGRQSYRLQEKALVPREFDPPWLRHYAAQRTRNPLGALVVKQDGRSTPLEIGLHKVSVAIRDQMARTTIEESFVNRTPRILEGEFTFPLPADAAIADFGMWIDGQLVEADVVEKQRAREIFDTIVSARRDPALLEWSGGNLFKARVFPIPANSEKRITLSYTQVLPRRRARFHYQYPLRSDMLTQNPLRDLSIDVKIESTPPLGEVVSSMAAARTSHSEHAAQVHFSAADYTPEDDFEVTVELKGRQTDAFAALQRADGGYFMLQFVPPERRAVGKSERASRLLPPGDALDLVLLADTSASMDVAARRTQAQLVAAILGCLGERDRFNLAACDVGCLWAFPAATAADAKSVRRCNDFLDARRSLGWTDLDLAMKSALARCGPRTQVIYLGDGIVTAGDADPQAFVRRLKAMTAGKSLSLHAIASGSSYEASVLQAMASVHGSFRHVDASYGPAAAARDLLAEMLWPGARDLKIEFRGLKTTCVYPAVLPNLPSGTQQLVVGRYLPEGADQTGEAIVTGTLDGTELRLTIPLSTEGAASGPPLLPPLWASRHVAALLARGPASKVREEIVSLSEQYRILTPFTSFLVLESDADRELFQVGRRYQIADSARLFPQNDEKSTPLAVEEQVRRARVWRNELRGEVRKQLRKLGRNTQVMETLAGMAIGETSGFYVMTGGFGGLFGGAMGGGMGMGGMGGGAPAPEALSDYGLGIHVAADDDGPRGGPGPAVQAIHDESVDAFAGVGAGATSVGGGLEDTANDLLLHEAPKADEFDEGQFPWMSPDQDQPRSSVLAAPLWSLAGRFASTESMRSATALVPISLPPPPAATVSPSTSPAEVRTLAKKLLRTDQLTALHDGLRIEVWRETTAASRGSPPARTTLSLLVGPTSWLARYSGDGMPTLVIWRDPQQCGAAHGGWRLGVIRRALRRDITPFSLEYALSGTQFGDALPPTDLGIGTIQPLDSGMGLPMRVVAQPSGHSHSLLMCKSEDARYETRVLIDTHRGVALNRQDWTDGTLSQSTTQSEFHFVAGAWWPGRIETADVETGTVVRTVQKFVPLKPGELQSCWKSEQARLDGFQFLHEPLPMVSAAMHAAAAGKAAVEDEIALALDTGPMMRTEAALEHLRKAARISGKPGMRWLTDSFAPDADPQKLEDAKMLAAMSVSSSATAAQGYTPADLRAAADTVLGRQSWGIGPPQEDHTELLDILRPVFERQPDSSGAVRAWLRLRYPQPAGPGATGQRLAAWKQFAADHPQDVDAQGEYSHALVMAGQSPAARQWLDKALARQPKWSPADEAMLRGVYADALDAEQHYDDLVAYLADWCRKGPCALSRWARPYESFGSSAESPYQRYLAALRKASRAAEADTLIATWLREGLQPGVLPMDAVNRVQAAIEALQDHRRLRTSAPLMKSLEELAAFFLRHPDNTLLGRAIFNRSPFRNTAECRRLCTKVAHGLPSDLAHMTPSEASHVLSWASGEDYRTFDWAWQWPRYRQLAPQAREYSSGIARRDWEAIAAALRNRWDSERDVPAKDEWGVLLNAVLQGHATYRQVLAQLREQLAASSLDYQGRWARQLFDGLLDAPPESPWSQAEEDEAFSLLGRLAGSDDPEAQLAERVAALHRLTDRLLANRIAALDAGVTSKPAIGRKQRLSQQHENLRLACRRVAERLRKEAGPSALGRWIGIEQVYFDIRGGGDARDAAAQCWRILGPRRTQPADDGDLLENTLQHRCLATLIALAGNSFVVARADGDRLIARLKEEAAADHDSPQGKLRLVQAMLVLGRDAELTKTLRSWVAAGDATGAWRIALGYLSAGEGRLQAAIEQFETVRGGEGLLPEEHRTLAGWYGAVGRRDAAQRAVRDAFEAMSPEELDAWFSHFERASSPATEGARPNNVMVPHAVFAALRKAGNELPRQDARVFVGRFYADSHDPRILAAMMDSIAGLPFSDACRVLRVIGDEVAEIDDTPALADLAEKVRQRRNGTKGAPDRCALDLLEAMAEHGAAKMPEGYEAHDERALAALRRVGEYRASAAELLPLAECLETLAGAPDSALSEELIRRTQILLRECPAKSDERLDLALAVARTLWKRSRDREAYDCLATAIEATAKLRWLRYSSRSGDEFVDALLDNTKKKESFARAETVLNRYLERKGHGGDASWGDSARYEFYEAALAADAPTSLGRGATLYHAIEKKLLQTSHEAPDSQSPPRLFRLYQAAKTAGIPGVADDAKRFAGQALSEAIRRSANPRGLIRDNAQMLHDVAGARAAVEFLMTQCEADSTPSEEFEECCQSLFQWTGEVGNVEPLIPRLLPIRLRWLRQELTRQDHDGHSQRDPQRDWMQDRAAFVKVAEEVLADNIDCGTIVTRVADWFDKEAGDPHRAAAILFDAFRRGILDDAGERSLVNLLIAESRDAEAIPILKAIVTRTGDVELGGRLLGAYQRTQQSQPFRELLESMEKDLRHRGQWQAGEVAQLGAACLESEQFGPAADYYRQAIALHRGDPENNGDNALIDYYESLTKALVGQGKRDEAVEVALAALADLPHDEGGANLLASTLAAMKDIDRYVAQLDRRARETGLDQPAVRREIGTYFLQQQEWDKAESQLLLAARLQPADAETHKQLMELYNHRRADFRTGERTEQPWEAAEEILRWREFARRDFQLYNDLAALLEQVGEKAEAARARRSIVEVQPAEPECHRLLAVEFEIRDRWADAIAQWRHVARLREREPDGLLRLAAAQIHEKQWADAADTLRQLRRPQWAAQGFDLERRIRALVAELPKKERK